MIVTTIDKLDSYTEIPYAAEIMKFIEDFKKTDMKTGRYELHGDDCFAAVNRYDTEPKEARKFENHKHYIDLQIVLDGHERLYWAPTETLEQVEEEFSKGGDIAFYTGKDYGYVLLGGDQCTVLFENDAHMPNVLDEKAENVLKIVFKIKK